jgi:hypothetical protein
LCPGRIPDGLIGARDAHRTQLAEPLLGALRLALVEERAASRLAVEKRQGRRREWSPMRLPLREEDEPGRRHVPGLGLQRLAHVVPVGDSV